MGKSFISKKTLEQSIVCILYHNKLVDLSRLIKSLLNFKKINIHIIVDGLRNINNEKKIRKLSKKIKITFLKKNGISYCRNYALKNAIKDNYKILLFLDSDILPEKNLFFNHLKFHNMFKNIPILAGGVIPTFFKKKSGIFTKLDGIMSWLGHIPKKNFQIIKEPYHLATLNMSIKIDFIKKNKIFFDEQLSTGEDIIFCRHVRDKGKDIAIIPNSNVHHQDRTGLKDVLKHQAEWGRHQFYTVYKYNFKNFNFLYKLIFFIFYPLFLPIISVLFASISIKPWINYSLKYSKYFLLIYLFVLFKGIYTYLEFFNYLKKKEN